MGFSFNQGDRPLAGYTIQRGVGRGGFGEVYYATSDGGKEVALKYLRENPAVELRGVSHCLNLKSPHLVTLYDIRQNDAGDWFVVMEYVSGPSLRDLLNAESAGLGAQKAAYFLREIGKGLAYLHDRGIVHRDLKPGNIFYEDGYVKIGDYGLAKLMAASQHSGQTVSVGTVHYMAPEVGSGNYDRTIDIYALGVMLYEMLLGRVPFSGATMGEVLMKHLTAQPAVDELPQPFPRVIRKALAKDPNDRYQTVQEMLSELFAVPAIDQSVAAFEPASLSTMAARVAERVRAQPVGVGGPGTPNGATLTGVGGSSNVGGPQDDVKFAGIALEVGRPRNRFERLQGRVGARMDRLSDRIDGTALGQRVTQAVAAPDQSGAKIVIALLVAAGMSFAVSLLAAGNQANRALYSAVVFLNITSIVQGVMIGTWLSYERLKIAGVMVPRLIIAAIACAGLLGSHEIARLFSESIGRDPFYWVKALTVTMIFCDWAGRLYEGRKGNVSLGSAFSVALFAFIAGMIFGRGHGFELAAIAAASSLALQAIGSLWPLPAGTVIPKTRHDDEEEKKPESNKDDDDSAQPVAVEPPGFARTPVGKKGGVPPPVPVNLAPDADETDRRLRRSPTVRALWLLASSIVLCGMILLYVAPNWFSQPILLEDDREADYGLFMILGTNAAMLFLFTFTRALASFKSGFWRGVLRPAIFFGGAAVAASSGIAMGFFDAASEKAELGMLALAGILIGGITSLFVWFVPVRPYRPFAARSEEDDARLQRRRARQFKWAGGIVFCLGIVEVVVLAVTLAPPDVDEVVPIVAAFMGVLSIGLFVAGVVLAHQAPATSKREKLALPLRGVFEIDANPNLGRLIERHLSMFGYKLTQKSDLLWSFERGNWAAQFWQSDVRQWKIKFNVAAYELDTGGYRVTCYVDMDASFNQPDQRQLAVLESEIHDLQGLLGGREIPSGATAAATPAPTTV